MNYSEKLKNPRWQRKRLKILDRDNFTCTLCGDTETTLHVHHKSYNGEPWEVEDGELCTHCEHCHTMLTYIEKNQQITWYLPILRVIKIKRLENFMLLAEHDDGEGIAYHVFVQFEGKDMHVMVTLSKNTFDEIISKING